MFKLSAAHSLHSSPNAQLTLPRPCSDDTQPLLTDCRMNHVLKHAEVNEVAYEPARPQHQSTDVVKGLLYNIPERYEDVNQKGRKAAGPAKLRNTAPFAQSENMIEADYPSNFHLQKHNKQVNDKVGHGDFDPEVYRANAMANINNRTQSRARNFVGAGNILSYNNK